MRDRHRRGRRAKYPSRAAPPPSATAPPAPSRRRTSSRRGPRARAHAHRRRLARRRPRIELATAPARRITCAAKTLRLRRRRYDPIEPLADADRYLNARNVPGGAIVMPRSPMHASPTGGSALDLRQLGDRCSPPPPHRCSSPHAISGTTGSGGGFDLRDRHRQRRQRSLARAGPHLRARPHPRPRLRPLPLRAAALRQRRANASPRAPAAGPARPTFDVRHCRPTS